jgi:hypothetical protein
MLDFCAGQSALSRLESVRADTIVFAASSAEVPFFPQSGLSPLANRAV